MPQSTQRIFPNDFERDCGLSARGHEERLEARSGYSRITRSEIVDKAGDMKNASKHATDIPE